MKQTTQQICILIVEDSAVLAQTLRYVLDDLGDGKYEIEICSSGEAGLELLLSGRRFSLLVSDFNLPGINGLEFLERAGEVDGGSLTLLMTAHKSSQVEAQALAVADAFLVKPFGLQEFVTVIRRLLSKGGVIPDRQYQSGVQGKPPQVG